MPNILQVTIDIRLDPRLVPARVQTAEGGLREESEIEYADETDIYRVADAKAEQRLQVERAD